MVILVTESGERQTVSKAEIQAQFVRIQNKLKHQPCSCTPEADEPAEHGIVGKEKRGTVDADVKVAARCGLHIRTAPQETPTPNEAHPFLNRLIK